MTVGFIYWLLLLLWLIFGVPWGVPADRAAWRPLGFNLLLFILLCLLGWAEFGGPIQDWGGNHEQHTIRTR